jgi:hypothetical protein
MPTSNPYSGAIVIAIGLAVILLLMSVGGCSTLNDKLATTSTTPVCAAVIGPIKYNTQKPNQPALCRAQAGS